MRFVFTKVKRHNHIYLPAAGIRKSADEKTKLLNKLRSFLDEEEPKIVKWLMSLWDKQQVTITYKELREAYLNGCITRNQLYKWQEDYSKFVIEKLVPEWEKAMGKAAEDIYMKYPYFFYSPSTDAAQEYIRNHGAELVTLITEEQKNALNAMIQQGAYYDGTTADEFSRIMRPCIGLTAPQSKANINYHNAVKKTLIKNGLKEETAKKKAADKAAKYAGRQHRYRAMNIARTELAKAYNQGGYLAAKDAQARGYMGNVKKVWLTAADERVCPVCGMADGEKTDMETAFGMGVLLPPAHPSCRCAVAYEEIPKSFLSDDFVINDENLKIETSDSKTQYYKPVEIDRNDISPINRGNINITARKINTANNNIYVSDNIKLKPKQLHNIDKNISEALKKLEVSENKNLPKVFIINNAEMQTGALASYNPIKNILCLDANTGNINKLLELQKDCACPNNQLSTFVHEFIHWKDAEEYKSKFGEIIDSSKYKNWLNKRCKKKLDELERKGYNISEISGYAKEMYDKMSFDETYTEYKVKELLKG